MLPNYLACGKILDTGGLLSSLVNLVYQNVSWVNACKISSRSDRKERHDGWIRPGAGIKKITGNETIPETGVYFVLLCIVKWRFLSVAGLY